MAWRDTLESLRTELAQTRQERSRQAQVEETQHQEQRDQLSRMATELAMSQLLEEMNSVLLGGSGELESYKSWESDSTESTQEKGLFPLDDGDEGDADYISAVLDWEEGGEREIAIDLGIADEGMYLQVNEIDTRPEREALEQALVEAFREELQL